MPIGRRLRTGANTMTKTVAINGVKDWTLKLPESSADEWLGNMEHHNNQWELPRLHALEKLIQDIGEAKGRRPVVLYVGAYKGDMAALLAKLGADLMLVESTAAFWPLIKETWDLNPELPEPVAFFSGLMARETKFADDIDLTQWPTRQAEYIEGQVGFTHLAESINDPTFPQITIDDLIKRTGIKPDIITMDIEGSELEALYGGLDTIINHDATYVLSVHPEFMYHNHGTYERELHDLLRNNKYIGTWLDYDHEHHWLYVKEGKA